MHLIHKKFTILILLILASACQMIDDASSPSKESDSSIVQQSNSNSLIFCEDALTESECEQQGCALFAFGKRASIQDGICVFEQNQPEAICFKTANVEHFMVHNTLSTYVKEMPDGSYDTLVLGSYYGEIDNGWHLCEGSSVGAASGCSSNTSCR